MRGTRLWLVIAMIAALFATALVAGCGDDDDDDATTEATTGDTATADFETIEEGVLTVGTDAPYPPLLIGTPDDPDFSGYEIDLFNAIAEKLGYEVSTRTRTSPRSSAMSRTACSTPKSLLRRPPPSASAWSTSPIRTTRRSRRCSSPRARTSPRSTISAARSSAPRTGPPARPTRTTRPDASEVRGFPQGPDAITALITGQVDATIIDQPVAADAVEKQGGVEIAEEIQTNELYGFAVAPDNDGLREAINGALAELKEDGTVDALYEKYFATAPPPSVASGDPNPTLTDD